MSTTKIFIIATCIAWIITGIACFTTELIENPAEPSKSDIKSISDCSDNFYSSNSNISMNPVISGTWDTPSEIVIFDTDGSFYILHGNVIIESGNYLANKGGILNMYTHSDGRYLPMCGRIFICQNRLYNVSQNQIWKFRCKCYI